MAEVTHLTEKSLVKYLESKGLKRSVKWAQKRRQIGGGPPFLKLGGSVLYLVKDVDAWLESLQTFTSTSEYQQKVA